MVKNIENHLERDMEIMPSPWTLTVEIITDVYGVR